MRPDLSIERLAITLAALGTTAVIAACTRAEPAAIRSESTPTPTVSAAPPPPQPDESKKSEGEKEPSPMATAPTSASAVAPSAPRRAPGGSDKKGGGQASCGAGTCTADLKKK
jgi:hypothetical protein